MGNSRSAPETEAQSAPQAALLDTREWLEEKWSGVPRDSHPLLPVFANSPRAGMESQGKNTIVQASQEHYPGARLDFSAGTRSLSKTARQGTETCSDSSASSSKPNRQQWVVLGPPPVHNHMYSSEASKVVVGSTSRTDNLESTISKKSLSSPNGFAVGSSSSSDNTHIRHGADWQSVDLKTSSKSNSANGSSSSNYTSHLVHGAQSQGVVSPILQSVKTTVTAASNSAAKSASSKTSFLANGPDRQWMVSTTLNPSKNSTPAPSNTSRSDGSSTSSPWMDRNDSSAATRRLDETRSDELSLHAWKDNVKDCARAKKLCFKFQATGRCKFGEKCTYSHEPASPQIKSKEEPTHASQASEPCKNFVVGRCRNLTCRFAHSSNREPRQNSSTSGLVDEEDDDPLPSTREIDNWLRLQLQLPSTENIEQLGSEKGVRVLHRVVDNDGLADSSINLLVQLLAKDGIRSSLMHQKTNRIYGILLRSRLLNSWNVGHVTNQLANPTAAEVRAHVLLLQELTYRTEDGWKEISLPAISNIVSNLEDGLEKTELLATVKRLTDYREEQTQQNLKQVRQKKARAPQKGLQGPEFRNMSIVPSTEELQSSSNLRKLPVNKVDEGEGYSSMIEYVETHFQLLREDCINSLRVGIKAYGNNNKALHALDPLLLYTSVKLEGLICGQKGVEYTVSFSNRDAKKKTFPPQILSKRTMSGSLLCISDDNFKTFFWGVIGCNQGALESSEKRLQLNIRILDPDENRTFVGGHTYSMAGSRDAYFEAYVHVLTNLQAKDMSRVPFSEYLVDLRPNVKPPSYLLTRAGRDVYNMSSAFPEILKDLRTSSVHILSEWPEWSHTLDKAQMNALKLGLTKELAIIQGPPGTGKTFLGLILVRILLANLHDKKSSKLVFGHSEEEEFAPPILIVCCTNHALDQFLEGIFKTEPNVIRVGGRSKSQVLAERNLRTLLSEQSKGKKLEPCLRRLRWQAWQWKDFTKTRIQQCNEGMDMSHVTPEALQHIASWSQIHSLFPPQATSTSNYIVKKWLSGCSREDVLEDNSEFVVRQPDENDDEDNNQNDTENDDDDEEVCPDQNMDPEVIDNSRVKADLTVRGGRPAEAEAFNEKETREASDVWLPKRNARRWLHNKWLEDITEIFRQRRKELETEYKLACEAVSEIEDEIQLSLLHSAKVVGMTTSSAAKHLNKLKSLKPEIVIVEEAAEVLEAHILACLPPSVKHLVLIGDHLQLRPKTAVYELTVKNKLDVSMFERLVQNGVEHVTLQTQRRMRPDISKLVKSLYPNLRNHESVDRYEDVKGIVGNVVFFNHKATERSGEDPGSMANATEAELIVELCLYLLKQGCYESQHITVLTGYSGQVAAITKRLKERAEFQMSVKPRKRNASLKNGEKENVEEESPQLVLPRVTSIDNYQGEEAEIIILSLVRSNQILTGKGVGKIGFLNVINRVCVGLTRARRGLYIFGNADLLEAKSKLWKNVISSLRESGSLQPQLKLYCQNHPEIKTTISKVKDFKPVEDGGCTKKCGFQLECGHACPRRCHHGPHDEIVCPKPCLRLIQSCEHRCNQICHGTEDCPPCKETVTKLLTCGHSQVMKCFESIEDKFCTRMWERGTILKCGHQCQRSCGNPCTEECTEVVQKVLVPCGHADVSPCHQNPDSCLCKRPCQSILAECKHKCKGSCGSRNKGEAHVPCEEKCGRSLPCRHICAAGCSAGCHQCTKNAVRNVSTVDAPSPAAGQRALQGAPLLAM